MICRIARMLTVIISAGIILGSLGPLASAEAADHVVFGEIYINEKNNGSEWIELYNPGTSAINIGNWVIDTKSDTEADITLPAGADISPHGFYFIGDEYNNNWNPDDPTWLSPDYTEAMALADPDGWVRLRTSSGGTIVDIVGWGTSDTYETSPADAPAEGESLQRKIDAGTDEDSSHGPAWDTNDNSSDFFIQNSPDPQNSSQALPPIPELITILLLSLGLFITGGYLGWKRHQIPSSLRCIRIQQNL